MWSMTTNLLLSLRFSFCAFAIAVTLCWSAGCNKDTAVPARAQPPVREQQGASPTVDELPPQLAAGSNPAAADDVEPRPEAKSGIVRALREQVETTEPFAEGGVVDPLLDILTEADEILSQAKLRNMEAIRQTNRQVRVGAARLSPHIVLVIAERLRKTDLGCYGDAPSRTPAIDRLAESGMRFTNYYAGGPDPDSGFWSLLTGNSPQRAPRNTVEPYQIEEETLTIAEVLWKAGYNTAYLGNWKSSQRPVVHGFDEWVGRLPTHAAAEAYPEVMLIGRSQMRIVENSGGQRKTSIQELLIAETKSYIDRAINSSRPFFVIVSLPSVAACQAMANSTAPEAALTAWDEFVGDLTSHLAEKNLQRRTCVMFTALCGDDNARSGTAHPTANNKHDHPLTESRLQAPLIVSWAGNVAAQSVSDRLCVAWDLSATCFDLAQVSHRPANLPGLSLLPALRQKPQPEHLLLLWESRITPRTQAVRKGKWKGVYVEGDKTLRLYDLEQDPHETTDVAAQHPEIVKQLIVNPPAKSASKTTAAKPAR